MRRSLDEADRQDARLRIRLHLADVLELATVPWKYLGFVPQPGGRLGIAARISDNDSPDTVVQECTISTAPTCEWNDPTTWGTLVLVEP